MPDRAEYRVGRFTPHPHISAYIFACTPDMPATHYEGPAC